jgi:hypothetical protein
VACCVLRPGLPPNWRSCSKPSNYASTEMRLTINGSNGFARASCIMSVSTVCNTNDDLGAQDSTLAPDPSSFRHRPQLEALDRRIFDDFAASRASLVLRPFSRTLCRRHGLRVGGFGWVRLACIHCSKSLSQRYPAAMRCRSSSWCNSCARES